MRACSPRTHRSSTGTASCIRFHCASGSSHRRRATADGSVRRIERMEFHPKLAIDLDVFRIGSTRARGHSPHRRRRQIARSRGEARGASAPSSGGPMLREAVIGVGVYQGMEFVLQQGFATSPARPAPPRLARAAQGRAAALAGLAAHPRP